MEIAPSPGVTPETVPLEAESPFEMRVHLGEAVPDMDVRAALKTGDLGFLHSFTTGSAVDGPGIRLVAWTTACMFRCQYCHNPDTWTLKNGIPVTLERAIEGVRKYAYGLKMMHGGFTLSGGEPLMQDRFATRLFAAVKGMGVHTAIETNGYYGDHRSDEDAPRPGATQSRAVNGRPRRQRVPEGHVAQLEEVALRQAPGARLEMRINDAESGHRVRRHRTHPEIRMRVQDRDAHLGIDGLHQSHDAFGRHHRAVLRDASLAAGGQGQRSDHVFRASGGVQRLGGDEPGAQATPEAEQLAQPLVLDGQRLGLEYLERQRIALDGLALALQPRGAPALGAALQPHERRDDAAAER